MAYEDILDEEIAEGAPLDNATLTKIQGNFEYLKANTGAGGAPEWSNSLFNGAFEIDDQGCNVLRFSQDVRQAAKMIINVPSGFEGGIVPQVRLSVYSPLADNTKQAYLSVTVGLIKRSSAINTPVATFTNDTQAANSSVANDIQKVTMALANAGGMIGAEAIEGGDQLSIEFSRKADDVLDTITDDLYMIPSLTELKFS